MAQIELRSEPYNTVPVVQIKAGECFVHNGALYMRSDAPKKYHDQHTFPSIICTRLADGCIEAKHADTLVLVRRVKIVEVP